MDCRQFQDRLHAMLEDGLTSSERAAADRHAESCGPCRELREILLDDGAPWPASDLDSPAELTRSILERTSGSPCGRARTLLCERSDDPAALEEIDHELLRMHLERCDDCLAVSAAFELLACDLPAMAELSPGAGFANRVLAATSGRSHWSDRFVAAVGRMFARPRFAWEAAYVGAFCIWLVFGSAISPLRAAPSKILELAQHNPLAGLPEPRLPSIGWAWQATGGRSVESLQQVQAGITDRYDETEPLMRELRLNGSALSKAATDLEVQESARILKDMRFDLGVLWDRMVSNPESPDDQE